MQAAPGFITLLYNHPDYLPGSYGPVDPETTPDDPIVIELQPFGSITGRVEHQGEPVPDFRVYHYTGTGLGSMDWEDVEASEHGTFTIPRVPLGEVELLAVAPGLPQAPPVLVDVLPGEPTEVTLTVPPSGDGGGVVVDAATGEPVAGASLRRVLMSSSTMIGTVTDEPEATTGADGSYTISGLGNPKEYVVVRADGYQDISALAARGDDGSYAFGTTELKRETTMTLAFTSDAPIDWAECVVWLEGMMHVGPLNLPESGVTTLGGGQGGVLDVNLQDPDGRTHWYRADNPGAGPYQVDVPALGAGRGVVELLGAEALLDAGAFLRLEPQDGTGRMIWDSAPDTLNTFERLPTGPARVSLVDGDGELVARGVLLVDAAEPGYLALEPCAVSAAVRVVELEGAPVSGVRVLAYAPEDGAYLVQGDTGSDGVARLGCPGVDEARLVLRSDALGTGLIEPVALGDADVPVDVVFDARAELELELRDGEEPLPGVMLYLEELETSYLVAWPRTDDDGRTGLTNLAAATYRVTPMDPDLWPLPAEVTAGIQATGPAIVQARRRGDLRVLVKDAFGQPVAGIVVSVRSEELETSVAGWLEAGSVEADGGTGLVTDADGVLVLRALPRGTYTVTSGQADGSVIVPPGSEGEIELVLPAS